MRMSKYTRCSIVNAIMIDVPKIDYQEKIAKIVMDHAVASMPPKVRAVWDDPQTRGFLRMGHHYRDGLYFNNVAFPRGDRELPPLSPAQIEEIKNLYALREQQDTKLGEAREMLFGVVNGYSDTTRLLRDYPQWARYVPGEAQASRNVPTVTGVIDSLIKLGWPKGEETGPASAE